jgi:hypothetical protein
MCVRNLANRGISNSIGIEKVCEINRRLKSLNVGITENQIKPNK